MIRKSLCEISNPKQWKTISTDKLEDEGYPVYGANGIIGYYSEYNHDKKTLLITCRGATCGSLNICEPYSYVNGNAMAIDNLAEDIDIQYLYYYLLNRGLNDTITGTAQPQIVRQSLQKVEIKYPELDAQYQIVDKLNQVTDLINKRKQQLSKLDELVKARFVEMFGDPVSNSLEWKTDSLKNVTSKIGSGATPKGGKESYKAEGITLIRSMNVHDGRFEYKDLAYITDEQAKQLDNVTIEEKDVFINITGASVARSCIVPAHILPARVNQHVAIIRCITSMINPVFLNNMFLNHSFKRQLLDIGEIGGATRQAITKQQLESLKVILPPIELQNQFAAFVEQTDKSKSEIQKSLEKLEMLKKALLQKYFG